MVRTSPGQSKTKRNLTSTLLNQSYPNDTGEKLIFEKMVEAWVNRQNVFEANWLKTYSYILKNYCTTVMQTALNELPVFENEIKILFAIFFHV